MPFRLGRPNGLITLSSPTYIKQTSFLDWIHLNRSVYHKETLKAGWLWQGRMVATVIQIGRLNGLTCCYFPIFKTTLPNRADLANFWTNNAQVQEVTVKG